MPKMTPKEKCFADAVDTFQKYNKNSADKKLPFKISHQTSWAKNFKDKASKWSPVFKRFEKWYYIYGYLKNKFGIGAWQVRYPDITLEYPDGSYKVIDNKFTRANGQKDQFSTKKGKYSWRTQKQDYKQINKEQGHDSDKLHQDENTCHCKKRKLEPVRVNVLAPDYMREYGGQSYFMPFYEGPMPQFDFNFNPLAPGLRFCFP